MNCTKKTMAFGLALSAACAGVANAGNEVLVEDDIAVSTTWTADNTYNLQDQIYVLPGATLTIEPGTVVASTPSANGSGSLAITRGAKIIAKGRKDAPIIFTSTNDDFVNWREAANEWGNITIMGRGYVGLGNPLNVSDGVPGNTNTCGDNVAPMEGLVAAMPGDPNVLYGGTDDDDDSGCLEYVSIRYGGRVVGLTNELNGLSLGGIGRGTDINHVEIMNNVDDGIEIWGGTVNLKYFSIWNIGDDSLDVDQGWRGKAQFGLIVQGYSVDDDQGSGVGDNCIEIDGAENADVQPVTTAAIYNVTVIGQPAPGAGDGGTAWRDGARVQYRNCIWMDLGEKLVRPDGNDGDQSDGYGHNGTLPFAAVWTTPYTVTSPINACANPGAIYTAQSQGDVSIGQGFLAEITDSVFFRNLNDAYADSDAVGVTVAGGGNPAKGNVVAPFVLADPNANMPIVSLGRAAPVTRGGKTMVRVISIDPRASNAAATSESMAPDDGFFTPANYRGGFAPDENWLCMWTAADAYGFSVAPPGGCPPCPTSCAGDIASDGSNDPDGVVDTFDLLLLLSQWGTAGPEADFAGDGSNEPDGVVDTFDLLVMLAAWGACE